VTAPAPLPGARLLVSLDPTIDQLNHGAFGAAPLAVQRVQQRLRDEMEASPPRFLTRGLAERMTHARTHLAAFIGADPRHTALVANPTAGVSVVLHTLGLRPGDEVITTDHGYGAVDLAIAGHGGRRVVAPVKLDASDDDVVAAVLAARTPRTRLVIIDLTSPTARIMPAARVVAAMRAVGVPVLVDAAHAPGAVPLDVAALGADFFVGNVHKWAYAPRGTALLAVAPQWQPRMRPLMVSWAEPDGFPANVEFQGSLDYTGWLAAPTGLYVLRSLGVERVRRHNDQLAAYGQRVLAQALDVANPRSRPAPLPMRLIPLPPVNLPPVDLPGERGLPAGRLRELIAEELRTDLAITSWRGRLWLRICAQVYNTAEQYERLAERLPGLLKSLA
jgi:isopenicillin-N epimerase